MIKNYRKWKKILMSRSLHVALSSWTPKTTDNFRILNHLILELFDPIQFYSRSQLRRIQIY